MKKKTFLLLLALPMALQGFSQTNHPYAPNIDIEEDTTHVTSLDDIIEMQELAFTKNYRSQIVKNVWKRKKYFSISYANTTLSGTGLMVYNQQNGEMEKQDTEYKTDWGVSIKRSDVVAFHKKPIADILSFGIEYSFLDISANHYAKDENMRFDSRKTFKEDNEDDDITNYYGKRHYVPWGSEMYTFAYGMHLGPSITLAPFAKLRNPGVAHIRLHAYINVGYRASLMWLKSDDQQDLNFLDKKNGNKNGFDKTLYETVSNSSKLSWGHGLVTTWGIRLSWKGIGIGYEVTNGDYDFKFIEKEVFGSEKFKFSETSQRISLSYIW